MSIENHIDRSTYEAVARAAKLAYRQAAELVAPRVSSSLVAGAGQLLSDAEWRAITADVADEYGNAYLDALIAGGTVLSALPPDREVQERLLALDSGIEELASVMRRMLEVFVDTQIEEGVGSDSFLDLLLESPQSPLNGRKAEAFARTATNSATNAGFSSAFRAARVPALSWITRRDDKVRDAHREVDRDVVPNGQMFTVGGYPARFPGDPSLPIGLRIFCRCVLGYVDGDQVKRAVNSTKRDVYTMARHLEVRGRSKMNKPELQLAVINALCLQGLAFGPDCPDVLSRKNMATLLVHARLGGIKGRYRMRRPELLAAVEDVFLVSTPDPLPITQVFAATDPEPVITSRLTVLADDVINGSPVSVDPTHGADLIEILGRHPEPVDLTLVRINPSLFTSVADNTLARDEMPQIPEDKIAEFRTYLDTEGVTVSDPEPIDPLGVSATQNELDGRKVGKMITAIRNEQFRPDHPAYISSDNRILDGHHRWAALAALAASGSGHTMNAARTSVGIADLLEHAHAFAALHDLKPKSHGMASTGAHDPGLRVFRL